MPKFTSSGCVHVRAKSLQSCPTLCDPVDCSLPGSSVHGILQAKILEQPAIPSSRGSSQPRDQTFISYVFGICRQVLTVYQDINGYVQFLLKTIANNYCKLESEKVLMKFKERKLCLIGNKLLFFVFLCNFMLIVIT